MGARLSIGEVAARVRRLPALPHAVHELRAALRDDQLSTERVVRALSADPSLSVTVLRLANSSFYGVSGRVGTLADAVHMLGLQTLSSAVITVAAMRTIGRGDCPGFDFDACWRHALATALCAQTLARSRGVDPDAAYLAGLLHDVGRLALAAYFPTHFSPALAWAAEKAQPPVDAELAVMGVDHAEVGGLIAAHWQLPAPLVDAIRFHHAVPAGRAREVAPLVDVLHLSDNIIHALDLSHEPDDMVPALSLATWERIAPSGEELQQVFEQIEARMQDLDVQRCA